MIKMSLIPFQLDEKPIGFTIARKFLIEADFKSRMDTEVEIWHFLRECRKRHIAFTTGYDWEGNWCFEVIE